VAFQPRELGRAEGTLVVGTAEGGSSRVSLTGVGYVDLQVAVSTAGGAQGPGGSVTGAGGQVDCSERCSVRLRSADRSTVTLRAVPAAGFRFEGWSGDCGSADASCTLQMTSSRSVTATFAPEPGSPAP
jgi:uncharacterized repeat protein (TIGR02543 family)